MGPGSAAWAGWHNCGPPARPSLAGQAYVGVWHGTQTAEFKALLYALAPALAYVERWPEPARPRSLQPYTDNLCIYLFLIGEWRPRELALYHRAATDLTSRLFGLIVALGFVKVDERHPTQKLVHSMCGQAHKQVLRPEWRPSD
jgi:hypothetical protein